MVTFLVYICAMFTPDKLLDSAQSQFLYYWNQFVNTTWTFVNIIENQNVW